MKQTNRKSAYLHCLRTRIDVAALMENTRRIFGRAQEANLSSRRVFLNVLAGHKKLCGGPHVARGPQFAHLAVMYTKDHTKKLICVILILKSA